MSTDQTKYFLRFLIQLQGRAVFPEAELRKLVSPRVRGRRKAMKAYNLCNGSNTQKTVATKSGLDAGQFNKMLKRWMETGIVFAIGDGKSPVLLHVYPLQAENHKTEKDEKL